MLHQAIDTETHLFGPGNMSPKIVCLSISLSAVLYKDEDILIKMTELLNNPDVLIIGHNVAYDMRCFVRAFPKLKQAVFAAYETGRVSCTVIRERLLDIAEDQLKTKGYALADLSKKYLGEHLEKIDTWRLRYSELEDIPLSQWPQEAIDYAQKDADVTSNVWEAQEKRKERMDYSIPTEAADVRAAFALGLMSSWGIETDQKYTIKRWNEEVSKLTELATKLSTTGLVNVSAPQLDIFSSAYLALPKTKKNLDKIRALVKKTSNGYAKKTEKGNIKTDAKAIENCNHPDLKLLLEFSRIEKGVSTFLSKVINAPIVHANFHAVGGTSNRTSCSGPNLQQIPRAPGFRECFVPRAGHLFLACDFDSQEMRTLGQAALDLCGHSKLARMYQRDRMFDPHNDFAKKLFHTNTPTKEQRQQTKVANFGFPGGLKARSFVAYAQNWGVETTEQEGQRLLDMWFEQWPEMTDYFRIVGNIAGSAGYGTQTIKQSGFRRQGVGYNDCANGFFQTLAAHASKQALWEVTKKCFCDRTSKLYGSRPVLFIHDEIILETPEFAIDEAGKELEQIMINAMEHWTPDVPAAASASVMHRWSKK